MAAISKKKLIPIVLLAVIALVVAMVGLGNVSREVEHVAEELELPSISEEPVYATLGRFTIPIIRGNRITAHFYVTISLEMRSESDKNRVFDSRRQLRDAIFRDLSSAVYWPDSASGYHLPLKPMKKRLLAISKDILGPEAVYDVLIVNVMERKL